MDLVSVITPTWQRPELLAKCIENVKLQTYKNIEHIIVSDGPVNGDENNLLELGFNTSSLLHNSFGIGPLVVGMLRAKGKYQIWLSDDDEMDNTHIEKLINLIENSGCDFVYSKCRFYWKDYDKDTGYDIGTVPPRVGQITNFLYRTELLYRPGCMPVFGEHPIDWNLVRRWIETGATYTMLDEVTFYHRADRIE